MCSVQQCTNSTKPYSVPAYVFSLSDTSWTLFQRVTLLVNSDRSRPLLGGLSQQEIASMSVSKISLHVETRNVLRSSKICVLQRSKPDVFQIWNAGGQTLRLNLLHVHEVLLLRLKPSRFSAAWYMTMTVQDISAQVSLRYEFEYKIIIH
jgi:hypothetical protein